MMIQISTQMTCAAHVVVACTMRMEIATTQITVQSTRTEMIAVGTMKTIGLAHILNGTLRNSPQQICVVHVVADHTIHARIFKVTSKMTMEMVANGIGTTKKNVADMNETDVEKDSRVV